MSNTIYEFKFFLEVLRKFDQQYCKQTEGLAMDAPTTAILAEVYIHTQFY
jgi:hypothetical protein